MTEFVGTDWYGKMLEKAIAEKAGVPGEMEDYLKLSGQRGDLEATEAFNIFIRRWVDPQWWPHLMDDDDNEAEYVRRHIRGEW